MSSFDSGGDRGRAQGRESTGRKGKERKGKERKGEIERERVVMKEEREGGKESQERGSLAGGEEGVDSLSHTHTHTHTHTILPLLHLVSSAADDERGEERRGEERRGGFWEAWIKAEIVFTLKRGASVVCVWAVLW